MEDDGNFVDCRSLSTVCTHGTATPTEGAAMPLTTATLRSHVTYVVSLGKSVPGVSNSIITSLATYVVASSALIVRSVTPGTSSTSNKCWYTV